MALAPDDFKPADALGAGLLCPSSKPNHLQHDGPPRRRQRASQNLTVALAPDDFKPADALGPSDFLVRGLAGFDPQAGVLLVGGGARLVRPASAAPTSSNPNLTLPRRAVAWGQLVRYRHTGRVLWEALLAPAAPAPARMPRSA